MTFSDSETYKTTHPWLKFWIDLSKFPLDGWTCLGECRSKCEHISRVPLRPATAHNLHLLYLAKGVLATTAIEGNTLTEQEVLQHLEGKLKLPPSREYLKQEVDNIINECAAILRNAVENRLPGLSVERMETLNRLVLDKLSVEEGATPGKIRKGPVVVARYKAPPADECGALLTRLCQWLNSEAFSPPGQEIIFAILKAVIAHVYFVWIHPFDDGNGRTARLIEFQILIASGIPAPAAHLLSNHYNLTRSEYYRQLDHASKSGGDIIPFLMYAIQGFRDGLASQLEYIHDQQLDIIWRNFIHEKFADDKSPSGRRRKYLALDLSGKSKPIPILELKDVSSRVANAYAGKTQRTLFRDLEVLLGEELIVKEKEGFRAKKEMILGFLPKRAAS